MRFRPTAKRLDSQNMFIRMPGACKKFYIVYDDKTATYYAASNWTPSATGVK